MNFIDESELSNSENEKMPYHSARTRIKHQKIGSKNVNESQPNKPGKWKSLGVRPKYDPETNEPTKTLTWDSNTSYQDTTASELLVNKVAAVNSTATRKPGRPAGSKNKVKSENQYTNISSTDAPSFTSSNTVKLNNSKAYYEYVETRTAAPANEKNILAVITDALDNFVTKNREEIMVQCNWSTPTFYRKCNMVLSNADKEMIGRVTIKNISLLATEVTELVSIS